MFNLAPKCRKRFSVQVSCQKEFHLTKGRIVSPVPECFVLSLVIVSSLFLEVCQQRLDEWWVGFTKDASVRGVKLDAPYSIFQHSNLVPFFSKIKKRKSQEGRGSKNMGWLATGQTSAWCILTNERGSSGHWVRGRPGALPDPKPDLASGEVSWRS